MITELQVRRDAIAEVRAEPRDAQLADGQAEFAVEHFALTSNNVTYAVHGVDFGYWNFFPAEDGWGVVPVWGFARVVASRVEGLSEGERFYGYWPMASGAVLTPAKVSPRGFVDAAAHRNAMAPVYNGYTRATAAMGDERVYALFRPLFLTSFVLDASFAGRADNLIISSASAKTALGLAQVARARGTARIVGLTSAANRAFAVSTGYHDEVVDYGGIGALDLDGSVAFADVAGNGEVRRAIHERFAATLTTTLVIGDTHWDVSGGGDALPGPRPEGFFAPTVIADRVAAIGQPAFEAEVEAAWLAFTGSTAAWLRVVEIDGAEAVQAAWTKLAGGSVDPAEGIVAQV